MKTTDLCRKHGISHATFYKWKARNGGMDASQLKRIRKLEAENSKLKRMYAELSLVRHALKQALFQPRQPNEVWSIDFISDSLWDGRTYRLLNVMDDYNREALSVEADTIMTNAPCYLYHSAISTQQSIYKSPCALINNDA